jgi:hypothetical protein
LIFSDCTQLFRWFWGLWLLWASAP